VRAGTLEHSFTGTFLRERKKKEWTDSKQIWEGDT
jgi:hypothetical protein